MRSEVPDGQSTWQGVQDEVLRRLRSGEWPPGTLIPAETELAREFACARGTVNRALRELADAGLLDRRRRAGTRVSLDPVRKATLEIPVIRHEVEATGSTYGYTLISRSEGVPPVHVRSAMRLAPDSRLTHLKGLHLSSGAPYAHEDRWLDTGTVPDLASVDFAKISANEWLVRHVPYSSGDLTLYAAAATPDVAEALGCDERVPVFTMERVTRLKERSVTFVRLTYRPGHMLRTRL